MKNYDINKQQNEEIKDLKDCIKNFVSIKITIFIATTLLLITTTLFAYSIQAINILEAKALITGSHYLSIEAQLAQIQADLVWIKKELNNK